MSTIAYLCTKHSSCWSRHGRVAGPEQCTPDRQIFSDRQADSIGQVTGRLSVLDRFTVTSRLSVLDRFTMTDRLSVMDK